MFLKLFNSSGVLCRRKNSEKRVIFLQLFSHVALSVNGNQKRSSKFDLLYRNDNIRVTKPSFHPHDVLEIFNGILFQNK